MAHGDGNLYSGNFFGLRGNYRNASWANWFNSRASVRNFGDSCFYADSDYKRYNRAKMGNIFGGDYVVGFERGYNNCYCGGNKLGFWGGFGMTLGFGLAQRLVSGVVGGFSNMINGWANNYSNNYSNSYINNGTSPRRSYAHLAQTPKTTETKQKPDQDYAKILELGARIDALDPANLDEAEVAAIEKAIKEYKHLDKEMEEQNNLHLAQLGVKLAKAKNPVEVEKEVEKEVIRNNAQAPLISEFATKVAALREVAANGKLDDASRIALINEIRNVYESTNEENHFDDPNNRYDGIDDTADAAAFQNFIDDLRALKPNFTSDKDSIIVNGKAVKIADIDPKTLDLETLKGIQFSEIKKLEDSKKAKEILSNLGYLDGEEGKMTNIPQVLWLLQQSGIVVQVEHRAESQDPWTKGTLHNVNLTEDGILSYDIDCTNVGDYGGIYSLTATDNSNTKFKGQLAENNEAEVTMAGIEVEYDGEGKPLKNKSGQPWITKNS